MTPGEIRAEDVGTALILEITDKGVAVDLSGFTRLEIVLQRPDGRSLRKTATLVNDGTDGEIQYLTVAGDLSDVGEWKIQGYVEGAAGAWHTTIHTFHVHENL